MNRSESIAALSAALAVAQGEFKPLAKNRHVTISMKSGGSFKFRYADLEATIDATRPALSKNGLSIIQPIVDDRLLTLLIHSSGEFIESSLPLPSSVGDDPKQYGAKISYLRRYQYQSIVCVMADDDLDEHPDDDQKKPDTQKQKLTDTRFKDACDAVVAGKFSKEKLLTDYDLTPEQRHAAAAL